MAVSASLATAPGVASADATDDYPIPNRILKTSCTAQQILSAARDVEPIYYQHHMIDYNNTSPEVRQAVRERINWFFSMDTLADASIRKENATNAFYEQLAAWNWPNWAKVFSKLRGWRRTPPTSARSTRRATCPPGSGNSCSCGAEVN